MRSSTGFVAVCVLLACSHLAAAQVVNIGQTFNIMGSGTTSFSSGTAGIGALLSFAYRDIDATTLATYWATSSGNGANSAIAGTADYGIVNSYFSLPQNNPLYGTGTYWTLMQSMTAEVIGYSMPEIPDCGAANAAPGQTCGRLLIDRLTYTNMWLGNVIYWDDASMAATNGPSTTGLASLLPHARVRYAYRSDAFGPTVTFLAPLVSTAFQYGVAWVDRTNTTMAVSIKPTWSIVLTQCVAADYTYINSNANGVAPTPLSQSSQCNFTLPCTVGSGILAQLTNLVYSTGQVPYPWLSQNRLQFFSWVNKFGTKFIMPTSTACTASANYGATSTDPLSPVMQSYLKTVNLITAPAGSLIGTYDAKDPLGWPFTEFHMFAIQQILHTDCFRALAVAQFLVWGIQSPIASLAFSISGSGAVPASVMPFSLNTIASTTCGFNGQWAVYDTIFTYEKVIIGVAIAFAAITWLIGIVVVLKRSHPSVVRVGPWALVFVCVIAGLNFFTTFLWVGYPTQPICQARPWISAISFMMIFGFIIFQYQDRIFVTLDIPALLEESAQDDQDMQAARAARAEAEVERAKELAGAQSSGSSASSVASEATKALRANGFRVAIILLLVICNFIIPIVWAATSPQSAMYRQCAGNYEETFRQLMIFYNIILIAISSITALTQGDKAQETSNPVHVFVLITALFIPLQFIYTTGDLNTIPDRSFEAIVLSPSVGIIVSTAVSMMLVVLPALVKSFTLTREEAIMQFAIDQETHKFRKSRRSQSHGLSAGSAGNPAPSVIKVQQ